MKEKVNIYSVKEILHIPKCYIDMALSKVGRGSSDKGDTVDDLGGQRLLVEKNQINQIRL